MTNLFSVLKLLCLDTLFLFCGPVAAKMKQWDEKWHYQDFLDLAVAPFPGVSSDSRGTQQLLAEVEGAISEQANTAWRSAAESKRSPAAKERNTQPPLPSLKKDILCIKSHPKAGGNKERLWNRFRCLATPASARHEGHRSPFGCLSSLGLALQHWGWRELQQLCLLMLLLSKDATRCYPNS